MSATLLPKIVIEALDRRRRAFLWTGEENCHGSNCLLAWQRVTEGKEYGGLGVPSLAVQNHSLLLKFVHKLHDTCSAPWKSWFVSQQPGDIGATEADSYIARIHY